MKCVCVVEGWLTLCALILHCTTGVQPNPAPEFNMPDSGQVMLLEPTIKCTTTAGDGVTHIDCL